MGSMQTDAECPRVEAQGGGVTSKDTFISDSQIFLINLNIELPHWGGGGKNHWDNVACPLHISQNPVQGLILYDVSAFHSQLSLKMRILGA